MTMKEDNKIYVDITKEKTTLKFPKCNIETNVYIGENGWTSGKKEGDGKTPLGEFELGIFLGMHSKEEVQKQTNLEYNKIDENMYWVDDINSKYYNQLVDITKVQKDWNSAEHLIDYPIQYEYLIDIKTNPKNIPGKGSAVFLHCTNDKPTKGCIAVKKEVMERIIKCIDGNTKIIIRKI